MWEYLKYIENEPLIFTQSLFWLFFGVVLLVYQFIYRELSARNFFLLSFSLYFYYLSSGWYFLLLLFSTVVDFYLGKAIDREARDDLRRAYVALSVFINLSLLGYFKYTFFFTESFNTLFATNLEAQNYLATIVNAVFGTDLDVSRIFLPVGISFFTFQTISYSVDIYRRKIKPVSSMLDFAFFVSFFPQLVAGPIVRAHDFIPQIREPYRLSDKEYGHAIFLIVGGLIKKIFISDYISVNFVDRVFSDPLRYSGFENLMGTYGYALQIYCDFSGYTDIAIGVALLLGFRLPLNFNSPYKAQSITDFWRRWHISLSSWLRDYLYISLGGNRRGTLRTYVNLLLTMLLGGLWHGAAGRFILWGALHGVALAFHKIWMTLLPENWTKGSAPSWYNFLAGVITFHFVCFCWMYFRADSMEVVRLMLVQMQTAFHAELIPEVLWGYKNVFSVMALGYALHWLPQRFKDEIEQNFVSLPDFGKAVFISLLVLVLFQVKSAGTQPFIYFQF
jgi:D-alanyl-lipoteichoic acid acyltransferase DltB (MBOAT superfamily)